MVPSWYVVINLARQIFRNNAFMLRTHSENRSPLFTIFDTIMYGNTCILLPKIK